MNTRKYLVLGIVLIFVLSALLAGCGGTPAAPAPAKKEVLIKAAEVQPDDYPTTLGLKYMAKLLSERSQGRIKMEVYANGQLGNEKETIEMTQAGTIAINRVNSSPMVGFVPKMGAFSMPFLFRDADHLWKTLDGPIGQDMLKELEKSNLVGLAYYDAGARSFYTRSKAINSPGDMKGQKIRVQQSKIFVDTVNTLGGSATPMGYGEVYSSLQSGIIDGAENNPPSLWASKHYEVAKFFALDEHSMVPEVVFISKKVFDSLSPEDQKLVKEAAVESIAYQKKLQAEYNDKALKDLAAKGVTISKVDKVPFQKAVEGMYEKYPEYKEVIEQIKAVK